MADNLAEGYKYVLPWNGFGTIVCQSTGINSIILDSPNALIYDMQGNRIDKLQKGVNIIRLENGKSKKIVVK